MTDAGRWDLPPSWKWARATEFASVVGGGTPKNAKSPDNYTTDGIPWITPADLSGYTDTHISRGVKDLSEKGFASCSARLMPKGTVLLSSRAPVGYCAVASNAISTNQGFKSFVLKDSGIAPEYLRYYLIGSKQYLESEASGTTFLELSGGRAEQLLFPLAPTNEQRRIVSKIDELFSRIDEGERALERVQELVERYRQSVLKAAVTGELTREWRAQNKDKLESGEALLARILKARRAAWEKAELEKMKAKGITPANDKWKQKYEEPPPPDTTDLPELPGDWKWASLDMLADVVGGITVDQKRSAEDCEQVPYLRVANVQNGYLDLTEVKPIYAPRERIEQLRLQQGDILFNEGGDIDKLGRGWIWDGQLPNCIHQNHVFRARLFLPCTLNKIISWYGNVLGRTLFMRLGKQTTNLASLSLSKLKSFPVPVMCTQEADEIVSRIDDILSITDHQTGEIENQMRGSRSLRQGVLKAAFSGQLVIQDPADEPASTLLERIAAERSIDNTAQTRSRKKKSTK